MSAPPPFVFGPPTAIVVERPCPLCGLTSPILVVDPPLRRSHTCRCGAVVGTPGCFVDDRGARLPLRAVFSPSPPPPCATCTHKQQRVLIDERPGVWCATCGLVALPERRANGLRPTHRASAWTNTLARLARRDTRTAAALAVVFGLVVAALHLRGA
jgi:hypothetical protein